MVILWSTSPLLEVGLYLEEAKSPNGLLAVELEILGMLNAR